MDARLRLVDYTHEIFVKLVLSQGSRSIRKVYLSIPSIEPNLDSRFDKASAYSTSLRCRQA